MPGLDKTGPLGQGSQTGRRLGRCTTDIEPNTGASFPRRWFTGRGGKEYNSNRSGDGNGPGRGFGRFWRRNKGRQV